MSGRDERKKKFLLNVATVAVAIALAAVIIKFLLGWILPFIFGFLIAAIVQPAVRFARRHWHMPKRLVGLLLALLFILGVLGICTVVLARLVMTVTPMVQNLPQYLQSLGNQITQATSGLTESARAVSPDLAQNISKLMEGLSAELMKVSNYANQLLALAKSLLAGLPDVLFGIAVTVISACFFSMDYDAIRDFLLRQMPKKYGDMAVEVKNYFFKSVGRMLRAYALLMLITFLELTFGLLLLRIPNAILVAVMIAVVDILPVLGTGSVMVPWVIIMLLFGNIPLAVGLAVLYAVIATVRTILEPKVVGDRIGLYPLITLFAIFLGLKFAGVAGMFLFPLIALTVKRLNDTGRIHLWRN